MTALSDASVVTRAEVEELLALVEQVHSPNNGTIAQLCRTWLAVDSAPTASIWHDEDELPGLDPAEIDDMRRIKALEGKRVRLVVIDTKGGGNLPPTLGEGDGRG